MRAFALAALPIAAAAAAVGAYLSALSIAAFLFPPALPSSGTRSRRFAVLVPAHNESKVIGRLMDSLRGQSYPKERFDVFVVADNCIDDTARRAQEAGAIVHVREDPSLRAKGYALRWLLERVRACGPYDAYVVFDADSEVAFDFLERMDARLATGAKVVQGHYRVLNADASSVTALREAALASLHYLRPLGREALGLSCGLKGNGMCFAAETLDRQGWSGVGLAEDVEAHLSLVREGIRVRFAPEAVVRADMPATLDASRTQHLRWEGGRLRTIRESVLPLLARGIRSRDMIAVDAAVEQFIPPLSVALSASVVAAGLAAIGGSRSVTAVALLGSGGIIAHVLAGLVAVRAPRQIYLALLSTPPYVLWKLALYARAVVLPASQAWVRTERDDPGTASTSRQ